MSISAYVRAETLAAANSVLVDAQAGIELAQAWGGGLVASIDGMRFVVPVRTHHARPNPKYFGRRTGITWLNMLNDQSAGLAARMYSGTPRDSLNMIDVVFSQRGGQTPEVIITDTGSYSDIVFGLLPSCSGCCTCWDSSTGRNWRTCPISDCGVSTPAPTTDHGTPPRVG